MISKPVPRAWALLLTLWLVWTPGIAQEDPALSEREEVTAIDLVVELTKKDGSVVSPPENLALGDFSVLRNGEPVEIVSLETPQGGEPWHILVYFDATLASSHSMRWAASALAERASALAELGEVEIVVADPEPRVVLAATRDADLLDQTLSGVFLKGTAEHWILSQREEFVLRQEDSPELLEASALTELVEEETRLVVRSQDLFLKTLVGGLPGTSRRAVLLVTDGFDLQPGAFYGVAEASAEAEKRQLESLTRQWARTVAAYGWSVVAVVPGEVDRKKQYGVEPTEDSRSLMIRLPGIASRLEGSLNPQRAAAQHELGQKLAEQGELEAAEEALREGLRFYHGHPRYKKQRAAVLADLGEVLLDQDRVEEARAVLREAIGLDPEREAEFPIIKARFVAPLAPLTTLAADTAGWLVEGDTGLSMALANLGRRLRLTFQLRGAPDGTLHEVTVALPDREQTVRGTSWVRFGTPSLVSAMRARQLLRGEPESGELELKATFLETEASYSERRGAVEITPQWPAGDDPLVDRPVRVTIGIATDTGGSRVVQQELSFEKRPFRVPLDVDTESVWFVVVVDDLGSGRWGSASADL